MSLKTISFALISFWLGGMALSSSEVVSVNRSKIDSFLVGKDGCKNNDVCPTSATCQTSDGLCKCNSNKPTYRTLLSKTNGMRGLVYGCVSDSLIGLSSNNDSLFTLRSDVIPFNHDSQPASFSYGKRNVRLENCSLVEAWEKTPNTATGKKLEWLDKSYVNLSVSGSSLYFKWKKAMPKLQGKIIYFNLTCTSNLSQFNSCLGGKILGNWSATASNEPTEGFFHLNTFTKIVLGVLGLFLIVIIILAIVLKCVYKKRQSNKDTCLEEAEMPNIDEKKEDKPESNFDSYAVVRRGRGNKGFSFNNGERTSDAYEDVPTGMEQNLVSFQPPQRKNSNRQSGDYEDMRPGTAFMRFPKEPLYKNNERLSDVYEEQDPTKKYTTLRRGSQEELEEKYQSLRPLQDERELQV